jgi:hypothetical protein
VALCTGEALERQHEHAAGRLLAAAGAQDTNASAPSMLSA